MTSNNVENWEEIFSLYHSRYLPLRVERLEKSGGFSGATIVRVETESGLYCLRGWPENSLPRNRIIGLHRLLEFVFQQGMNLVAVPVEARDGSTLVVAHHRYWQLEPWMPGKADFHRNPTEARLSSAMVTLARWHQAASRFVPHVQEQEWFSCKTKAQSPAVRERLEIVRNWSRGKIDRLLIAMGQSDHNSFRELAEKIVLLFGFVAPIVTRQLETAAEMRFALQPCLRDIWHDHLLYSGENVTGLIDASGCRTENVASDISRLLGSLICDEHSHWEFAIGEYSRLRHLSVEEQGLITVLDHSSVLLSAMTWLDRHYLNHERFMDDQAVLERLEVILRRLEYLKKQTLSASH